MDTILLLILLLLLGATLGVLYLNLRTKPKEETENKKVEEIANLKSEIVSLRDTLNNTINNSLGSMSTSFNNLSTGVTKDMTCLLYTSPSPRDNGRSRMPSSA